jgi:hypothetical protein
MERLVASEVSDELIKECSYLFSNHYGVWQGTNNRIKLSPAKLRQEFLETGVVTFRDDSTFLSTCEKKELIGHAMFKLFDFASQLTRVCWITQLVVHTDHRRQGIAKKMIQEASKGSSLVCIVSASPFAVRAIGKLCDLANPLQVRIQIETETCEAVRSPIETDLVSETFTDLVRASGIKYLMNKSIYITKDHSWINTGFFVEHTTPLPDGYEFLAMSFSE